MIIFIILCISINLFNLKSREIPIKKYIFSYIIYLVLMKNQSRWARSTPKTRVGFTF
jgi:hypothetical protein